MKTEAAAFAVINGCPQNVRRQEVAGELDPLKTEAQAGGKYMGQGGFPHTGNIFD